MIRPKTIRRLVVILIVMAVFVGVGVGLYKRNEHLRNAKLAGYRSAGMTAFDAGDYPEALNKLKSYVAKVQTDTDALYAYGLSRYRVEEADGHNVREARQALQLALQVDPAHARARKSLLEVTLASGMMPEASLLADEIL